MRWLHILAAALWVGPQVYVFLTVLPALRQISDPAIRRQVSRAFTIRYGILAWVSLGLLAATGFLNALRLAGGSVRTLFGPLYATPLGSILLAKHVLVLVLVILSAVHSFVLAPRLGAFPATKEAEASPGYLRLRRLSVVLSSLTLALSLAVLYLATLL